jgi:hypothetical protein
MPAPARKRKTARTAKLGEKAVKKLAMRYVASVMMKSFFRPYLSVAQEKPMAPMTAPSR